MPSRRDLLLAFGAATLSAAFPRRASAEVSARRRIFAELRIGMQLYTTRAEMRRDPEGTVRRIAELGYSDIEWWGSFGRTPTQLRALLDQHGLRSPAAHVDPRELTAERLPALLDTAATMGHTSLIVAWTPPTQRAADDWKRLAALLNEAGRIGTASGIRTGYHNHDFEFAPLNGSSALEILLAETDPRYVTFEMDCFWAFKAGCDPLALLRAHPTRFSMLHLKDSSGAPEHRQEDVGAGVIDWRTLLPLAISQQVTHAFVEHDAPTDTWATLRNGRSYLRALGY